MHEPVPFKTDDAILAFALYIAGITEFRTPTNTFTAETLKRLGYKGLPLWEAAQSAWKRGDRGHIEYWFERSEILDHLLKAYAEQKAVIDDPGNNEDGGTHLRAIMSRAANPGDGQMDEREALLRIAAVALKGRVDFVNRWKNTVPFLRIAASGQPQSLGEGHTRYPGFKLVPLNASEEMKKQLSL